MYLISFLAYLTALAALLSDPGLQTLLMYILQNTVMYGQLGKAPCAIERTRHQPGRPPHDRKGLTCMLPEHKQGCVIVSVLSSSKHTRQFALLLCIDEMTRQPTQVCDYFQRQCQAVLPMLGSKQAAKGPPSLPLALTNHGDATFMFSEAQTQRISIGLMQVSLKCPDWPQASANFMLRASRDMLPGKGFSAVTLGMTKTMTQVHKNSCVAAKNIS